MCPVPLPRARRHGRHRASFSATGKSRRLETIYSGWLNPCYVLVLLVRTSPERVSPNQFTLPWGFLNVIYGGQGQGWKPEGVRLCKKNGVAPGASCAPELAAIESL